MAGSPSAQKQALRNKAILNRRTVSNRTSRNRAIAERLESHSVFRNASAILAYVSMPEEVDTHSIIEHALGNGRMVLAPRAADEVALDWVRIETIDALQPGALGVLEPAGPASPVPVETDVVALIPGVAFDLAGHRLGWGKGYFDRFLATFHGITIGLAYDCQLYDALPVEPHDRPVNHVITEMEIVTPG